MCKIIFSIFLVLTFLCSSAMSETAVDWFYKANALSDGKKYTNPKKAIGYLNNAIKLQPNYIDAYVNRGNAYYGLGQYQRAIEDYNKAILLKPDYAKVLFNRGTAYSKLSHHQSAIEDYNEAIRLKPDYVDAYYNRGYVYLNQGNNNLGCLDAQKACALGDCKLLEQAKDRDRCH